MLIKEFFHKKSELKQYIVFYTNNDLLIPFLSSSLKSIYQNSDVIVDFYFYKDRLFGFKSFYYLVLNGDICNNSNVKTITLLKNEIENIFNTKIVLENSIIVTTNFLKKIKTFKKP